MLKVSYLLVSREKNLVKKSTDLNSGPLPHDTNGGTGIGKMGKDLPLEALVASIWPNAL